MKIKITQKHKSINPPCEFDLPDFSVLTGKNGSGKTHLLEAIANNLKSEVSVNGSVVENVKYIGFNGLNPNITESCDPQSIIQTIKTFWTNYNNHKNQYRLNEPQNNDPNRLFDYVGNNKPLRGYIKKVLEGTKKAFDQLTEDDFADYFDISFMGQDDF